MTKRVGMRRLAPVALLFALALLSACGFHLRGTGAEKVRLPPTYLAGHAEGLKQEVRRFLAIVRATVVDNKKDAQLVITLLDEQVQRRVLSVDSSGRVNEYEVDYTATFTATRPDGRVVVAPDTLTQQGSYTFNQAEVLAKNEEEERLVQDMRRQAVQRMMLRVQAKLNRMP